MAIVLGFVPWIVYWVLVGNAPFTLAVGVAFAITVLIEVLHRVRKERAHTLEIGNLAVFAVLTSRPSPCRPTCWNAGCNR